MRRAKTVKDECAERREARRGGPIGTGARPSWALMVAVTALVVAALALAATAAAAAQGSPAIAPRSAPDPQGGIDTTDCRLELGPTEVRIRSSAVLVSVRASEAPGRLRRVTFPARSGVVVLTAAPAPDSDEVDVRMALDTSGARPGRWPLVLTGAAGDCRGTLTVRRGDEPDGEVTPRGG